MKSVIYGTVPSKSNCYKIIKINGHGSLCKTPELKNYERSFHIQYKKQGDTIDREFGINVDVYYPSKRADLDNSLKVILDCLQKAQAIKNDNKCIEIHARRFVDKDSPRIEFELI